MNMKKIYQYIAILSSVLISLGGCQENKPLVYDVGQKDAVFFSYKNERDEADSTLTYNFNYDIATEHVIEIPVTLMGMPKNAARKINIRPIPESTDMVEGTHYIIESAELPPQAITSNIKIRLLRGKDPKLQEQEFTLRLGLYENEDLRPTGSKVFVVKYSDIRPTIRPDWWSEWAPLPEYSFEAAQVFFEYFYRLAPKANKDVFDEMMLAYGDYFVKAKALQGPMAMYNVFIIRYVLIPMHLETGDRFKWQQEPSM